MSNTRINSYISKGPASDELSFSQAIEILRDGVGSSYGDRITPAVNILRVADDIGEEDYSHAPLNDKGNFLFLLFRYQNHTPRQIQDGIKRSIRDATADSDNRLPTQVEVEAILKEAARRKRNEQYPYS